ncbi:MoxR-like ATPase [Plasticicumulans lactativorans]|uniref:MoxR-like ATPase n=1 Tax=Plasticicumulans lactativorans TaxID=1133106 RepID=A0A4R2L093_9GAMM|nr:AAA family ATPase [Plasticicumulans lactativorans]TCO79643.1 MoxR-like ATPase [Plasticicumulans lactativorans]
MHAPPAFAPADRLAAVVQQVGSVILGKERAIRLALTCLLARGHLLIEDLPGLGKTTLAHALGRTLGLEVRRIQFTSDLLPADILGAAVYDREQAAFVFHPGPVFAQLVLADEINRASPKTQSALLEAMEEGQVTSDGHSRPLPVPFFVIATQNPMTQLGTFPLPESQLDRFLMRLTLGYPDARAERALLAGEDRRRLLERLSPLLGPGELTALQARCEQVHLAPPLLDYAQALLAQSRFDPAFETGLSPRAGQALLRAARAWALLEGRDHALPEDVQAVLPALAGHRLRPASAQVGARPEELVRRLLSAVPVPV